MPTQIATRHLIGSPRYLLAVVSGLLLAAAFPKLNIAGFAWIAPGLVLGAALGCSPKESFRVGYVAGLTFWLASLYWLLLMPVTGFPILGWVALSAYLALFQGIWVWLCWKCSPKGVPASDLAGSISKAQRAGSGTGAPINDSQSAIRDFQSTSRLARLRWSLFCALVWVALEMIRSRLFTGFPWSLLGVSQYR